jgi:isopentenyldiphosphate isomerase
VIPMPEEFLDIVDENDNVIGRDTRENVHNSTSWHRGVHILVFNGKGEMLIQKRSSRVDKYKNLYSLSASGHVRAGETYEECARNELSEELGVRGVELEKIAKIRMNHGDINDNMIGPIYRITYDGAISFDKKDIRAVEFFPLEKLKELVKKGKGEGKFTPFAYDILMWYFGMDSKFEVLESG